MSKSRTIPWDPKQWLGDNLVAAMEREARSMHFDLLMFSVQEEPAGSIPNDTALLRRWLGSPSDEVWRRVWPQISSAWKLQDGRWFNRGMVKGVEQRTRLSERGKAGARGAAASRGLAPASPTSFKGFQVPSVSEVKSYCEERKNRVNPQAFVDFYSSKGWKVGSSAMKDWRAAVRTWEQRDGGAQAPPAKERLWAEMGEEERLWLAGQFIKQGNKIPEHMRPYVK